MISQYFILKLLHILLFVYWLGGDIGVFYSAGYVSNAKLSVDARGVALKILGWLDMIPRICLVLMLPVGYTLAREIGAVRISSTGMIVLWLVAALWLALVLAVTRLQGTPLGAKLRQVDLVWRILLTLGLSWDAYQGLSGTGHIMADWVSIKFVILAALIFCGIMLRIFGAPLAPALRELLSRGSSPAVEATISATFARTRPWVLAIWVGLICAAYVGIAKPSL
jgi:hypothetical protein